MTFKSTGAWLAVAIVVLWLPEAAQAESIVPPENSAAAQYTEAFPTGGGEKDVHQGSNSHRTPSEVMGTRNVHRLEAKGPDGRAAAQLAAETGPATGGSSTAGAAATPGGAIPAGGATGGGGGDSPTHAALPKGSSGLGEVVSQATGASSGGLGIWLPIALAGTAAWALAFWLRKRRGA